MTAYLKLVLVALVVAAVEVAWLARWEVIPVQTQVIPVAYQLDRWTGDIYFLGAPVGGRVKLKDK